MKIEICEQMIQTWLLHNQQCQIVQTNWTISPLRKIPSKDIQDAHNMVINIQDVLNAKLGQESIEALQESIDEDSIEFSIFDIKGKESGNKKDKKLNILKKSTPTQFIRQCEIDVVGVRLEDGKVDRVFLFDSAFHKGGLGYHNVVATVTKKLVRAILVANIVFGKSSDITVAFVAPECRSAVQAEIENVVGILQRLIAGEYPKVKIELYFNERFAYEIYDPLKNETATLNNDNDLFMRALNLVQSAENHLISPPKPSTTGSSIGKPKKGVPAIVFFPADMEIFKTELMNSKRAEITWIYDDGTKNVEFWRADNINANSNVKGNLQSRPRWRTKLEDGLIEVQVKVL